MKKTSDIVSSVFFTFLLIASLALIGCFMYQQSEQQKENPFFCKSSCYHLLLLSDTGNCCQRSECTN